MDIQEILSQSRDAMTVKQVFGEPIERNGITIVPVASVIGGAGGGSGAQGSGGDSSAGGGGGFGLSAKPAGVYVIDGQHVSWQPAIDANRAILGGQIVFIMLLFVVRSIVRIRHKAAADSGT